MKGLLDQLARLASLAYQRRFVVQGTCDEYVLPDELLDIASNRLQVALANPANLVTRQREALERLRQVMDSNKQSIPFDSPSLSNRDLVESNEAWAAIRREAARSLDAFDFDLDAWEAGNV